MIFSCVAGARITHFVAFGEALGCGHPLLVLRTADDPVALDRGLPALERLDHLAGHGRTCESVADPPPAITCDVLISTGEDVWLAVDGKERGASSVRPNRWESG